MTAWADSVEEVAVLTRRRILGRGSLGPDWSGRLTPALAWASGSIWRASWDSGLWLRGGIRPGLRGRPV